MTTATFEEINIALPSEMITMLKSVVEAGEYSSINEIVRDALLSKLQAKSFTKKLTAKSLRGCLQHNGVPISTKELNMKYIWCI
jgi:Arc/MetJ-type ribon-helix-helix transcriptional regulator